MSEQERFESFGRLYSLTERRTQFVDAMAVIDDLAGTYFGEEFDALMRVRELLWDHLVIVDREIVKQRRSIVEKAKQIQDSYTEKDDSYILFSC